jgi:hypothetical protein
MTRKTHWIMVVAWAAATVLVGAACTGSTASTPQASPSGPGSQTATPAPSGPLPTPPGSAAPVTGAYAPTIDPAAFSATVDNPFFPLRPGMRWNYRSSTPDGVETTAVTATTKTRTIMGVRCVEVRDTVKVAGTVKEDTLDWYAQDRDGAVWYFGEDTKEYENGKVTSTEGSWLAGIRGARPGILMPARPSVGDRYRQEYYKGHAEDQAEVLSLTERAHVPTGSYDGVVMTKETTPLEPDVVEHKYYARGMGTVLTVDVGAGGVRDELVRFTG